jgi:hypothetical protein
LTLRLEAETVIGPLFAADTNVSNRFLHGVSPYLMSEDTPVGRQGKEIVDARVRFACVHLKVY